MTSLHLAILKYAGLSTFYGTAVMPWFGEYPHGEINCIESFIEAATNTSMSSRDIKPFEKWSNQFRSWDNGDWKKIKREWVENKGWKTLNTGKTNGKLVIANLNTLTCAAGTSYFPDLNGKILLIEDMDAPWSREERSYRQLQLMGVFDVLKGLIIGKPERSDSQGANFTLDDLLLEVVGNKTYPIVSEFDCSHTVPMHTLAQNAQITLRADSGYDVTLSIDAPFVS